MNNRAVFLVSMIILAIVASGCGIFAPKPPKVILTWDDNNKTHTFLKGQKVELQLRNGYEWFIFVPKPNVFRQVIDAKTLPGIQGVYLASDPGTTVLDARGEAVCKLEGTNCNKNDVHFRINVIVQEDVF